MRNAFLVALALLAFTVPAAAADEPSAAAPVTFEQLTAVPEPIDLIGIFAPTWFCSSLHGTSCPARSGPRACTDVCGNQLSCSCVFVSQASGWRWRCQQEC